MMKLSDLVKSETWDNRNDEPKDWQSTQGITKRSLKSKYRDHDNPSLSHLVLIIDILYQYFLLLIDRLVKLGINPDAV